MSSYIRDAPLGYVIRYLTGNKYLQHTEELPGFQFPQLRRGSTSSEGKDALKVSSDGSATERSIPAVLEKDADLEAQKDASTTNFPKDASTTSLPKDASTTSSPKDASTTTLPTVPAAVSELALAKTMTKDMILVDWYSPDDPENPQNWKSNKKTFTTTLICLYTFVVYCGSAIFVPSFHALMIKYNVSEVVASLGMAVYVAGYGFGPMLFSPLSEIPMIGRNPPYVISFALFLVVSVALPFIDNFAGIIIMRFAQGFFGSPCLASGGASLQDLYSWYQVPYAFIIWVAAIYGGPAFGPLLSGYAVDADWRWSLWEIAIMAAPLMILMTCFLPETSRATILLHRAQRLRKVTGNHNYRAASENRKLNLKDLIIDAMMKPGEIAVKDPAIAFVCVYGSLVYAIFYSFFEAFPIVYAGVYGMSMGEIGLVFLNVVVGVTLAAAVYAAYLYYYFMPRSKINEPTHEARLLPALYGVWFLPIGLFLFAWTAREDIHWIAPTVGISIYAGSSFVVFQCIIVYVPLTYPDYVASLFASNDFLRSLVAAGFVMFSRAMYLDLGIDKGVSLLGGLSVMGILGMYYLYWYGDKLRAKSKFAVS